MADNRNLIAMLRARNLKATSTRLEVLSIIAAHEHAVSYAEIQNALQDFDRVTLYRTLHALMDNGIIHIAMIDEQETFYALCSTQCSPDQHRHRHIHFKCKNCRQVSCVQANQNIQLSIPGHQVDHFEIEATGICKACS